MSASTPASKALAAPVDPHDKPLLYAEHRWLCLIGVMLVSVCQFLDATIANVALPHMKAALGASSETISWVLTSFMLATAVGTPLTGWLSDRLGSRTLFIGSTVLFLATSAACGAATSLTQMVIFRGLQGLAAGLMGPMTMTIMFDLSPPSKQAMTMAVYSLIIMFAPISGPTIGGFLVEYANWRWIFYVNLLIGGPALLLIWWQLPSRAIIRRPLDLVGFFWLALALCSLQLAFDRGEHKDWLDSWEIIIELMIAISALWIFAVHSATARHPLFQRALFSNMNFIIGAVFMGILGLAVAGLSAVMPMLMQSILGYPVMDAGMLMAPRGVGVMVASLAAGYLMRRFDPRKIIAIGFVICAASMAYMTTWTIEMDSWPIIIGGVIQGVGLGLTSAPVNVLAFATLSPALRPEGSSLMSLTRSFGNSIGVSLVVTTLARMQQTSHADLAAHIKGDLIPTVDLPAVVDRMGGIGPSVIAAINGEVTRQATMIAFLDVFWMMLFIQLFVAPLAMFLKKGQQTGAPPPPMHE